MTAIPSGRVALVTGAARGIGRACAIRLAADGMDVVLLDVCKDLPEIPYPLGTLAQLERSASLCREAGVATLSVVGDVRDPGDVEYAVEATRERFGRLDVLVNNAGVVSPSGKAVHAFSEAEWSAVVDVDLHGSWRMLRAAMPLLLESRGSVVNVASTAGVVGYPRFAPYVAAKHALIGLTKAAALDYAEAGVRVNAVCPGSVRDTVDGEGVMLREIARSLEVAGGDYEGTFAGGQPSRALAEPSDVASAVAWLAGDDSHHVTGSVVMVDGGYAAV
ncbi:SDR family oxidoreductase [Tenggerimyces flavus]|uniref:SDR family oxidoreductase n=1 Tax=Tenggerimyces flavus TaxID=1708749 RepID=A0ABV7YK69_9ACTN|nr:SDR family oxidoreductase [Tenggerimyces flavus]MBM7790002.1 NAD(P)-dependent dehydrogenase (short-subunit alcohol dehydrogenase family) [Tenggerimyces flavus]